MSDHDASTDLKAGRPPASKTWYKREKKDRNEFLVRVGGMRVGATRPRQTSQGDDKEKSLTVDTDINEDSNNEMNHSDETSTG